MALMLEFLKGQPIILDGLLRIMPSPRDKIAVDATVRAVTERWQQAQGHVAAGRLPILSDKTKEELLRKAEAYETAQYGQPLSESRRDRAAGPSLFG